VSNETSQRRSEGGRSSGMAVSAELQNDFGLFKYFGNF
jgi:hypothetical protein